MAKWLAKEFDWDTGRYTGNYYDIAEAGIVAVFVDSFYGDNANDGTDPDTPYKTLGAAITYLNANGADGSRIFMNGIFSETLPTQTYWYEFIGCGGGWNGMTIFYNNTTAGTKIYDSHFISLTKLHNVRYVNYSTADIGFFSVFARNKYYVNVIFNGGQLNLPGSGGFRHIMYMHYSVFKNIEYGGFGSGGIEIAGNFNIIYGIINTSSNIRVISGNNNYYEHPTGGNFSITGINNITGVEAQFINRQENNHNVRITSPLLNAGSVDEITGIAANVGGVEVGLPYNGITPEFTTEGGATITDLTIDASGKFTITAPATTGTLETALMDLGNIYTLENIDLFNVFDLAAGEITQGVFETFSSPRMALTIKLKYGLTSAEVDDCPWLLIEYGKQPTFSGTGASRVGNADDTFDPDTFQEITCRYMKLFITLQNNS